MVLNIAHRGARSLAPENTLKAIRKAWEIGADGVEIDVAVSRDKKLFLLHDQNLIRTTNVSDCFPDRANNAFTTFTLSEIQSLDAGSWFIEKDPFDQISAGNVKKEETTKYIGLQIPTLEAVLAFIKEKNWFINIELKRLPAPLTNFPVEHQVIQLIKRLELSPHQVVISSFNHAYLHSLKTSQAAIEVQALIGDTFSQSLDWGDFSFDTYNANADLIDEVQIARAHARDSQVNLFTVNDPVEMQRFINAGIKGIMTDFPHLLASLLQQQARR